MAPKVSAVSPPQAETKARPPSQQPDPPRALWSAIILLAAVIVGAAGGLLSFAGGLPVPLAIVTGGGAFGGTVALLLTLANFLAGEGN